MQMDFTSKKGAPDVIDETYVSSACFNDATMAKWLPSDVCERFKDDLITGNATSPKDQEAIAQAMFEWARSLGATHFAHWFFPCRGGGGATGGQCSALKMDTFIDYDWNSKSTNKPFQAAFPTKRLFCGETDGSSFPNGGLRQTHSAAAFTTWDRSSPPLVVNGTLRVPSCFLTHLGNCIDEKTPLLRSVDAMNREALRLLKNLGMCKDARTVHSYLGWEQEFFIISSSMFKERPDLINCGRTLLGRLPPKHQQGDLQYFAPVPFRVEELLKTVESRMLKLGCPMNVKHNEVAPGQHEMSPIYTAASHSADSNILFMELLGEEAAKAGLQALFHEKPFAGINGSGKHANWSLGTDTGENLFDAGKTDESKTLFVTSVACLAYGMYKHNDLVRCAMAHAGNDHRLGGQEAPPAIVSLFPGSGFESHIDRVIEGAQLADFNPQKEEKATGCRASASIQAEAEDRNRTAPFPHCGGNRFEFRAVGSSQNCAYPVAICNMVITAGFRHLNSLLDGGMKLRDAVAQMYKENRNVVFTGNGYSAEWRKMAEHRGLPNLNTTPKAIAQLNSKVNKELFKSTKVFSPEETDSKAELQFEAYVAIMNVEVETLIEMMDQGIIPACAKDLLKYKDCQNLAGERATLYDNIMMESEKLKRMVEEGSGSEGRQPSIPEQATRLCDVIKPQMKFIRDLVDKAEGLMEKGIYPYPSYESMLYSHHF